MVNAYIAALADYAVAKKLIEQADRPWAVNRLLEAMGLSSYEEPETVPQASLEEILNVLIDDAVARGVIEDGIASRDLFDTKLMGVLTPRPSQVIAAFHEKMTQSREAATDWFYTFCQDTDYIRRYRIARDVKWVTPTEFGDLDITINLSKPE